MNLDRLNVREFLEEATARNPDLPFVIWQGEPTTYESFNRDVDRAAALWHGLGVRKGDRVAFMLDNCPEFLVAWLGLAKIGAVLTAINTGFQLSEVRYLVEHSESRFALVGAAYEALFVELAKRTPFANVLIVGEGARFPSFAAALASSPPLAPSVDLSGDDLISLIYTSGTTGKPKGVMQTHRNYVLTGQAYPTWVGLRKGERLYLCLPLFHINSQAYSTMGAIGAEGTIVLAPRFSTRRFWDEVRGNRVNVFNYIGAMTVILTKAEPSPADRDHSVRVAYGAPALSPELRDEIEARFGLRVMTGFGMSETTFGFVESLDGDRPPGSMGKPRQHPDPSVPRTEARLVAEQGNEVRAGEIGELLLRSCATMRGYFKDPERTAEALRYGWLRTGDLARRDADGYYYFVDRKKDMVRRRGENVSSLEVETVLGEHPDVLEAAIVGVPSELTEDDILAVVVPKLGRTIDPAALVIWCAERLAKFKVPRYVQVVDALPKTPTQKVEKHRLKETWKTGLLFDAETLTKR